MAAQALVEGITLLTTDAVVAGRLRTGACGLKAAQSHAGEL
jgi:hypothetical protein